MVGSITWIEPTLDLVKPARFGSDHPMRTVTSQLLPGDWTAIGSYAGTGLWLVARRC